MHIFTEYVAKYLSLKMLILDLSLAGAFSFYNVYPFH